MKDNLVSEGYRKNAIKKILRSGSQLPPFFSNHQKHFHSAFIPNILDQHYLYRYQAFFLHISTTKVTNTYIKIKAKLPNCGKRCFSSLLNSTGYVFYI